MEWIGVALGIGFVLTVAVAVHAIEDALGKIATRLAEIRDLLEPISREAEERLDMRDPVDD